MAATLRQALAQVPSRMLVVAILPLLAAMFLADLRNLNNYHADESQWLAIGNKAFRLYFVEHNFTDPFWKDDIFTFGSYNPQVSKYVIGAGTYLNGIHDLPLVWFDYSHSVQWNIENKIIPDPEIVAHGRFFVAVLGILATLLVYKIGKVLFGFWTGYLALCAFLGGTLILTMSRRAMLDTPALFFSLLAIWLTLQWIARLRNKTHAHLWAHSLGLGITLGLAASAKMNAILLTPICLAAILIESLAHPDRIAQIKNVIPHVAAMGIAAIFIFYISNPFLYFDFVGGVRHLMSLSQKLVESPNPWQTSTLPLKLDAIARNTLYYAPLRQMGGAGDGWFLLLGLIAGIASYRESQMRYKLRIFWLWSITSYIVITLWLPTDYDRYYLPLQPINALLQAYGCVWLARQAFALIQRLASLARASVPVNTAIN